MVGLECCCVMLDSHIPEPWQPWELSWTALCWMAAGAGVGSGAGTNYVKAVVAALGKVEARIDLLVFFVHVRVLG
jgi:hypothetical protein